MKYIAKVTYTIEPDAFSAGGTYTDYFNESGHPGARADARIFESREDAEYYLEDEKSDPRWDKAYLGSGSAVFEVEEA